MLRFTYVLKTDMWIIYSSGLFFKSFSNLFSGYEKGREILEWRSFRISRIKNGSGSKKPDPCTRN